MLNNLLWHNHPCALFQGGAESKQQLSSFYHVPVQSSFLQQVLPSKPRQGCKDIWNSYMVRGCIYSENDIPCCPTTTGEIPNSLITYEEALCMFRKNQGNSFFFNAYICFYEDDYKFDGRNGIWNNPDKLLKVAKNFAGVITPDFSTNQDFPDPLKRFSTYKMRAIGYWLGKQGVKVINNIRWGTEESFEYCFDGLPYNSVLAVGTVGGSPRRLRDRTRFNVGLLKAVDLLHPHTILVYGSSNYDVFKKLKKKGITVISYQSKTANYFERRKNNE